jgi:hypothetical protein
MAESNEVKIHEYESQLDATDDPQRKIDLMNALADQLRYTDLSRAMALVEQASDLSGQGDLARSRTNGARQLYLLGRQRSAQQPNQTYPITSNRC